MDRLITMHHYSLLVRLPGRGLIIDCEEFRRVGVKPGRLVPWYIKNGHPASQNARTLCRRP